MKKVFIVLGGAIVLVLIYWLVVPLFTDKQVSEELADIPGVAMEEQEEAVNQPTAVAGGMFEGRAGHAAEGTATLLRTGDSYYLRFEDDFRVTNGPDLFVYFGSGDTYSAEARVERLKGNIGGQNYEVPADIDPTEFSEVWIWCRAFSVPFAVANLE